MFCFKHLSSFALKHTGPCSICTSCVFVAGEQEILNMTVNETALKRKCHVNKINFNVIVDLWSNTQTTF